MFHEEIAEPNSFGFRPFRSPGWAQKAVTLAIWSRKGYGPPKYALELDIAKCFDTISHDFIQKNVGDMTVLGQSYKLIPEDILTKWLRSGYVDIKGTLTPKDQVIPTEVGVPQGGPISPTISNIVLNGIGKVVSESVSLTPVRNRFQTLSPNTKILYINKKSNLHVCIFGLSKFTDVASSNEMHKAGFAVANLDHKSIFNKRKRFFLKEAFLLNSSNLTT